MNTETQRPKGIQGYVAIAKRRRISIAAAFCAGLVATLALAALLPARYRSAGTVLIEQQEIPTDMVKSTVTSYADQRVQVISKRVMTTATLLDIIKRYNLYPKEQASDTREALLTLMRNDIGLKMISADVIDPRSGRPTSATIAFEVSYTSRSADQAARVANELTTLYLNENLTNRTKLAQGATDFLEGEGDRVKAQIVDLEAKLAAFKDKNYSKLPELVQLNMQLMDRNEEELRALESRLDSLEQQRVYLQAQLVQLKPNSTVYSETGERIVSSSDRLKMLRSQLAAAKARYGPEHPDVVTLTREVSGMEAELGESPDTINDLRRELQQAQSQLDDARKRYTAEHPDRVRLEATVKSLQADLDAAVAAGTPSSAPTGPFADRNSLKPTDADNPAYVQIQAQLSGTENDIKSLNVQIGKLRASIHGYETDVSGSPQVEREYHDLTRDLDNARLRYQEIRTKQGDARVAQSLESDRQGERFTLIDPPLPPEEPVSPNRRLILVAGLILSLGLGAAVAMLREVLDTTIRSRDELLHLLGVPPLALIPHIRTESDRQATRRRFRLALGSAAGTACVALVLVHLFYRPLDVIFFSLMQRLGM
ncbi:MAG TPA: GNVR domain-containing protein [Steroidobacteraceae bacterium]|nr:GNVR domain-containing protein [Steroidobacteraceae bacterium]